jgi:hypothetical protein
MRYEGWDRDQYCVVRASAPPRWYYGTSLMDFRGAWRRLNGVAGIPVNLFWYLVWVPQMNGLLPEDDADIQAWNGQWGNTVSTASKADAGEAVLRLWRMFYYSHLFSRAFKGGEVVRPYADQQYLQLIAQSSVVDERDTLRRGLVKHLDPGLAEFTNMAADGDRHQRIDDALIRRMEDDYEESWYAWATGNPLGLEWRTTEFSRAWSRWSAASLCEHLVEQDYEITVADD